MTGFLAILRRDLRLAARGGGEALTLVLFFVMVGIVVPFAVGPDQDLLAQLAPAIVWIAAFLAMLLGVDRLFRPDHEDGTLLLLRRAALPLPAMVLARLLAHWLVSALPLLCATPVLALLLAMDGQTFWRALLALFVGTPALAGFGVMGAALTVTIRRGGLIAPVLILPLAIPVLIFGVGAISTGTGPDQSGAALLLLAAISLICVTLAPFAAALAISSGDD